MFNECIDSTMGRIPVCLLCCLLVTIRELVGSSRRRNCLLVPDSSRPIMSSIQLDKQGHQPHAFGSNPGLVLFGDEGFIPFVREEETGFYLMPCMPPSFKDPEVFACSRPEL